MRSEKLNTEINEEMREERQRLKRFALKSARKLKGFHRKQNLLAGQNMTRGHDAHCHGAINTEDGTPSTRTAKKKKKKLFIFL